MRAVILLTALAVVLATSVNGHALTVGIVGNDVLYDRDTLERASEELSRLYGEPVRVEFAYLPPSITGAPSEEALERAASVIRESDVLIMPVMGYLNDQYWRFLSEKVVGTPLPRDLAVLAFQSRKRLFALVPTGERAQPVVAGRLRPGIEDLDAVAANLSFLLSCSDDPTPALAFALWCVSPRMPTNALPLPSDVSKAFLAVYVPGVGWLGPEVDEERVLGEYRRWLRDLASGKTGLSRRLRYVMIPTWAEILVEETRRYASSFTPPTRSERLVVVLNHIEYFHTADGRKLTEMITEEIDRRVRDLGVSAVAVCGTVNVVPPMQVVAAWKDKGYETLTFVKLSAFASLYPTPATWFFHDLDTPVIKPVLPLRGDRECEPARYCSRRWGPVLEWAVHVWAGPELEGAHWFLPPALKRGNCPGFLPVRSGIEALAEVTRGFVELRLKSNDEKRVLYVLYCYPPGRGSIGATYLDVFESMIEILAHMAERGYDVGPARDVLLRLIELERSDPEAAREYRKLLAHVLMAVSDLLLKNVGPWAKGELAEMARLYRGDGTAETSFEWNGRRIVIRVERGRVTVEGLTGRPVVFCTVNPDQLVPVNVAERWFQKHLFSVLEEYRKLVEEHGGPERERALKLLDDLVERLKKWWGDPSNNKGYMIWNGCYVIPCLRFGKVGIALQPPRGWSGNPEAIYHDPELPPHWQYITFYYWVKEGFHADAIVHVGTHGTLEWLPGHEFALLGTDWPYLLLRDVPHFYIYIISNPGEGKQAKYRSGPIILTHLPPAWDYFRDIGKYNGIWRAVTDYMARRGYIRDENVLREMARTVIEEARKVGLYEEVCAKLGVDPTELERAVTESSKDWKESFDEFVDELHDTLFDLLEQLVPYGLHTYGVPNGYELEQGALIALPSVAHFIAYWVGKIEAPNPEELAKWQAADPDGFRAFQRKAATFLRKLLERLTQNRTFVQAAKKYVQALDDTYRLWRPDVERARTAMNLVREDPKVKLTVLQALESAFLEAFGTLPARLSEDDAVRVALDVYRVYAHYAASPQTEIENLLRGLEGCFIEPGCPWAEPFWNPDALPTGRNGTIIDPRCIPTPEAWRIAVKLVDEMLADYYAKHGRWPESVAVVIWGIHELITGGLGVATALYLLGVRPVWNPTTGRVVGVEPIPLDKLIVRVNGKTLRRPRIDAVLWTSGCFQDLIWPGRLLEEAFWLVSHLDEPPEWNHRRAHYLRAQQLLLKKGVDPQTAEILASSAAFSHPVGVYTGAGVNSVVEFDWANATRGAGVRPDVPAEERRKLMEETFWERVQRAIEAHMAYLYTCEARIVRVKFGDVERYLVLHETVTREVKGERQIELFRYLMSTVDAAVHNIVNVWGLLDCDDYYDWLGGINFYVYKLTGKLIDVYVQYAVNPSAATVRTLAEELAAEVRTKFLSDSWMRAFLEHGDYGWARIAERMEFWNAWGIVAPQIARLYDVLYDQVAENLLRWIETKGPVTDFGGAAVQSVLAWMVEAMRIGTWNPKPELGVRVIEAYVRYTAKYGPATCHHTSATPFTVPFAVRYLELYAPEKLKELRPLIERIIRQYARLDSPEVARRIERYMVTSRTSSVPTGETMAPSTSLSGTVIAGTPTGRRGGVPTPIGLTGPAVVTTAYAAVAVAVVAAAAKAGGEVHGASTRTEVVASARTAEAARAKMMARTSSTSPVSPPRMIWIWVLGLLLAAAVGWLACARRRYSF
ncbi:cobaltochelatase subunit CobN [Methanopyrus kandleri]